MTREDKGTLKHLTDKLYGGVNLSWPKVLLLAVSAAALTAAFLIVPAFKGTSFGRMGVYLEAWIFLAVIIMSNCKKPMESALKVFVFFLVSQPLIYLIQVPFSSIGWALFGYYRNWFIMTLLTFPMAYIGWYITKKNWLSVLIFLPVLAFLAYTGYDCASACARSFPSQLVAAMFCFAQVLLYVFTFFGGLQKKLAGLLAAILAVAVIAIRTPQVDINVSMFLPDDPILTESAAVTVEDTELASVSVASTGESSMIQIHASKYGTTAMTIYDGDNAYHYALDIYADDGGHPQVRITPQ